MPPARVSPAERTAGTPTAIGILRQDISGRHRRRDERIVEWLAQRWGYELPALLIVDDTELAPTLLLIEHIRAAAADAVIAPDREHIWPARRAVTELCDLILAGSEKTWSRGYHWPPFGYAEDELTVACPRGLTTGYRILG
ncbi:MULTISPECIES: hypothetical protein [unclassified Nocardia]|uniref:hypothetical protein n=1 Tax=unclassified Nocardia TaxID=2637762 RepID=UPI001CE4A12A|nr:MULTISPECIES: hypothetical protein [unclassified Nocardia]